MVTLTADPWVEEADGLLRFPRRWLWPRRLLAVARAVGRVRPDVVYAVGMHEAAALGARLAGCPLVARIPGDHAWERARRLGLTRLSFDEFQHARGGGLRVRAMRRLRSWAAGQASVLVVPSHYLEAAVRRWAPGVCVEVVPVGIEVPQQRGRPELPSGALRVAWVGRLVALKRLDALLKAVAAAPGVELVVIGDGPERGRLADQVRRLALDARVHFRGSLERSAVFAELAAAHALALVSEHEGLPHVAVEALAAGVPVIAPDTPWAREIITDGETGILVREPGPSGFAAALARLRDDANWRATLARGAAARAEEWSLTRAANRLEGILLDAYRRPAAVLVGRGGFEPPASVPAKFAILARHLDATVVSVRPRQVLPALPVRTVTFPRSPRVVASVLFYSAAPVVAVALAAWRRGVVVCQSPYEAAGARLARGVLPRRVRPRMVVEVHGDWRTATRLYGSRWRRLLAPGADRLAAWALRGADRVRAVSAFLETVIRQAGYGGEVDRYVAFSDFAEFLGTPPVPLPERPVALFAAVLEPDKAPEVLLDAWAAVTVRMPQARLVVAGRGPMEPALRARAGSLGLDGAVEFAGHLPRDVLRRRMDAATCLVLPSRSEGLPRVVIEALARGRPVVGTAAGGIPELVQDGITGRLVPVDDASALAAALLDVLTHPERAAAMGAEGRRRVEAMDPAREFEAGIARLAGWAREAP